MKSKIDWQWHTENWKTSGLSKAEYCRQNQLNKYSFYEKSRKVSSKESLIELPFRIPHSIPEKIPAFEFHFQVPFQVSLRLNLIFGNKS